MTDKQQPPPERIWIDPQDSTFWNDTGDVKSLILYARVQPVDEAQVETLAKETWDAICAEATRGGDKTSVEIISSALVAFRNAAYKSERHCGECGHNSVGVKGTCSANTAHNIKFYVPCGCTCVFPTTGAGAHPEDFCEQCGQPNIVWFAPSPLWNLAIREQGLPEILCPVCFIKAAESVGIKTVWRVAPDTWAATGADEAERREGGNKT